MGDFKDMLKALREKKGLTQEALARAAGLSLGHVARLEQGRVCDPGWSVVKALAKALGVSVAAFDEPFGGDKK
jgi:transcriptional regulator with XRE-family HTH domain